MFCPQTQLLRRNDVQKGGRRDAPPPFCAAFRANSCGLGQNIRFLLRQFSKPLIRYNIVQKRNTLQSVERGFLSQLEKLHSRSRQLHMTITKIEVEHPLVPIDLG